MQKRGYPRLTLHDLIHSCATIMLEQRVSIRIVSKILGHHSPDFTMGSYIQPSETLENDAKEKIEKTVSGYFKDEKKGL